jgi:hypothetical protein
MLAKMSSKIQQARTLRRVCEMGWDDNGTRGLISYREGYLSPSGNESAVGSVGDLCKGL